MTSSPPPLQTNNVYRSLLFATGRPNRKHAALISASLRRKRKCPRYCNCNGNRIYCAGSNTKPTYLPKVAANIRYFRMMWASLKQLTRPVLTNLSNFDIEVMNLTYNKVAHITPDTFTDFAHMKVLDLSGNPVALADLGSSLRGISSKVMKAVYLWEMGLTFIPDNFFEMFFNMTFKYVDLHSNHLNTFNSAVFAPFWSVEKVDLSKNQISTVNMSARIDVDRLFLRDNNLEEFPDFCLHGSPVTGEAEDVSAFYNLQSIYIYNNPIRQIGKLKGACLPALRKLDISELLLKRIKNNFISDLPKLMHLIIRNMRVDRVVYEPFAFNSSSLLILKLMDNPRLDPENVDPHKMFLHCPNLERLIITNVKLDMSYWQIYYLLRPLTSLKMLILREIRRGFLPANLLGHMPRLETLSFAGNNLYSNMLAKALTNVTTLKHLNVQANRITVVNETVLPWNVRRSLETLDISLNIFACTCELLWFKNWLDAVTKNKSVKVLHYGFPYHEYYCNTPPSLKGTQLRFFSLTEDDCLVKSPLVLIGIVGASVLVLMVALVLIGYRYRWHWRFYLYRIRRRHKYVQIPGGLVQNENGVEVFIYDAYLAHSAQDLDWIVEELLPVLEGEHGLKVFLDERDSIPGTVITDNITQHMDESARVLLLISDSYNREGWRQCEFEHIMYAAVEQQKDVIVVLLGDVEAGRMTRDMRRMLTRGTFLQWGNSEEARKVFKNGLKLALKTQNANMQSLC